MAGLNLRGGVSATSGNGRSTSQAPSTAGEAAFGPGYTAPGTPSTANALAPTDPFGVAFCSGVLALALLMVIRHSLPR